MLVPLENQQGKIITKLYYLNFLMGSKITEYFKETKTELKHVIWPSRRQTLYYTLIVIILSLVIAYYLGIFDFIFSQGLKKIITP